jgi:hypothetical protein
MQARFDCAETLFSRYSDCLLAQIFQTAACNAIHTIIQRTWLLAGVARTNKLEFEMTQDQLAEMLGVGRTFVTRTRGQASRGRRSRNATGYLHHQRRAGTAANVMPLHDLD